MKIDYIKKYGLKEQEIVEWGLKKYPDYVKNIQLIAYLYLLEQGKITTEDIETERSKKEKYKDSRISKDQYEVVEGRDIATTEKQTIKIRGLVIMDKDIRELILCRRCSKKLKTIGMVCVCGNTDSRILKVENYGVMSIDGVTFEISRYQHEGQVELKVGVEYVFYLRKKSFKYGLSLIIDYIDPVTDTTKSKDLEMISDFILIVSNEPNTIEKEKMLDYLAKQKLDFEQYKDYFTEKEKDGKKYLTLK